MKRELPEGATVKFSHARRVEGQDGFYTGFHMREGGLSPSPRGGTTVCTVTLPDGTTTRGEAFCNPKLDNYSKKIGRDIALGRALKALPPG